MQHGVGAAPDTWCRAWPGQGRAQQCSPPMGEYWGKGAQAESPAKYQQWQDSVGDTARVENKDSDNSEKKEDRNAVMNFCQAPMKTPPLYDGCRLLVYRVWDQKEVVGVRVTITTDTGEGKIRMEVTVDQEEVVHGDLVHKMFARKMIKDLEEKYEEDDSEEVQALIEELGLKYNLAPNTLPSLLWMRSATLQQPLWSIKVQALIA